MLFSELHSIAKTPADAWFDPILDHDTKLFIDPFLIFRKGKGVFANSHNELIAFFQAAFTLAARTGGKKEGVNYKKLLDLLLFPEVDELRLGYAAEGEGGAGTAKGFAREFADSIMESIALGLSRFDHFEEIGIFNRGIGRDRISDITANVLKHALISYTQDVCNRHGVPTQSFVMRTQFDATLLMWEDDQVYLPVNPFTDEAVLLVPRVFLRTDPTLQKEGFKDYLWEKHNEELRNDFNYVIKKDIDTDAVIGIAREHPDWVQEYVKYEEVEAAPSPYDLDRDPAGLYRWHQVTKDFVEGNPFVALVKSEAEFVAFVRGLADKFKLFVEMKGGWKLVWDKSSPMSEAGIQHYFYGVAYHYCAANNILMQREVETGRGPVDFYFSTGLQRRALIEAKLAKNGHFWNNVAHQLPEYMTAEGIVFGHYLIVCYRDADMKKKVPAVRAILKAAEERTGYTITSTVVDARPHKPSASKLK
jgi:hypothetical protein